MVPDRYAGGAYVIVDVDANQVVDQWPNGTHNLEYQPINVNPIPFPDLVLSNVVVPTQVIAGSTFNVSYTVTNLGSARPWLMTGRTPCGSRVTRGGRFRQAETFC